MDQWVTEYRARGGNFLAFYYLGCEIPEWAVRLILEVQKRLLWLDTFDRTLNTSIVHQTPIPPFGRKPKAEMKDFRDHDWPQIVADI
jgi:hypothetical protein